MFFSIRFNDILEIKKIIITGFILFAFITGFIVFCISTKSKTSSLLPRILQDNKD